VSKKDKEKQGITVRYKGPGEGADVIGLGYFQTGIPETFTEPDKAEAAKTLAKTNINFEEVSD
jgi:hypothetical protein